MSDNSPDLVNLWEDLLSRNVPVIRATFSLLEDKARNQVIKHLRSMANQPGWHMQQVISAKIALEALSSHTNEEKEINDDD